MNERVHGFQDFVDCRMLDPVFDAGGIVAGGVGRFMLRNGSSYNLSKYFSYDKNQARGDVDAFFPDVESMEECMDAIAIPRNHFRETFGKGAFECMRSIMMHGARHNTKLQLVKCRTGTPEEILDTFDFANCKVAFNREHVWIDTRLIELEKKKILQIDDADGPIIGPRVCKYFMRHDYLALEDDSRQMLIDWMLKRLNSGKWGKIFGQRTLVQRLVTLGAGVISDKDLVYFIGKARQVIKGGYHPVTKMPIRHEVDVAATAINERKINQKPCHNP